MDDSKMLTMTMILSPILSGIVWLVAWLALGHAPSFEASLVIGSVCGVLTALFVASIDRKAR